ncbi:hypothetical protein KORDIASMS9_01298 [Kordia sp. SMS9]|uniref:hypothetical protein n=1 Tax=Kordia sp. SMS9 TaxID=2282170 RepID=UPI000E0DADF9|nr:hypothetical protein [Kordia sp. SMS9]AXG69079.1 hypothetical protein KORDIASMS9_01298 [Kordia sp. SMS9]
MKKKNLKSLELNKKSISNLQVINGGNRPVFGETEEGPSDCNSCRSQIPHGTCNDDTTPIETFTDTSKQPGTMCN